MHKQNFIHKGQKSVFIISQNADFADDTGRKYNYDHVYRIVDISGNLISEINKFDGQGYGFGTVVKMSIEHLEQLDKNIKKMVQNAIEDKGVSEGLQVNEKDNKKGAKFEFEVDGIDFVTLVKIVDGDAYVIILDSMPNYLNYHFLFAGINNFKNKNMSFAETQKDKIEDKKNNFYFYFGDENTDSSFDNWLEEEAPKIHNVFRKLGITKECEEED